VVNKVIRLLSSTGSIVCKHFDKKISMATPDEQAIAGVVADVWTSYDVDPKDGKIEIKSTEFGVFYTDTYGGAPDGGPYSQGVLDQIAAAFDEDKSGYLTEEEMTKFIQVLIDSN